MNRAPLEFTRVLAVDIASRGLGFAVLEGPLALIDWGFHNARDDRDAQCVTHLVSMFGQFEPDVLVIEDLRHETRRTPRVKSLAEVFATAAKAHGITCYRISRKAVRSRFPACRDKYAIASDLAARFPEIKPSCPPKRKFWMTEDPRINIFDALSLAMTHVTQTRKNGSRPNSASQNKTTV